LLGIGRNTPYEAAKSGDLPVVRVCGRLLVPRARLVELLGEDPVNCGGRPKEVTPRRPLLPNPSKSERVPRSTQERSCNGKYI
jgi:hypothetical protein